MIRIPRPGNQARGSKSGRPIMALLDLLGRRWTLRLLWELRQGPLGFRALQARCDQLSPTSLSQRLRELRTAGILDESQDDVRLSPEGKSLLRSLAPLQRWAERWSQRA